MDERYDTFEEFMQGIEKEHASPCYDEIWRWMPHMLGILAAQWGGPLDESGSFARLILMDRMSWGELTLAVLAVRKMEDEDGDA